MRKTRRFGLTAPRPELANWREMVTRVTEPRERVRIAVVGKYTDFVDSYKSVQEALIHGGIANDVGVDIHWLSSDDFTDPDRAADILSTYHGLLVPGDDELDPAPAEGVQQRDVGVPARPEDVLDAVVLQLGDQRLGRRHGLEGHTERSSMLIQVLPVMLPVGQAVISSCHGSCPRSTWLTVP